MIELCLTKQWQIIITDYVNIVNKLIKLAEDNKVKKALVDNILEQQAETKILALGNT